MVFVCGRNGSRVMTGHVKAMTRRAKSMKHRVLAMLSRCLGCVESLMVIIDIDAPGVSALTGWVRCVRDPWPCFVTLKRASLVEWGAPNRRRAPPRLAAVAAGALVVNVVQTVSMSMNAGLKGN